MICLNFGPNLARYGIKNIHVTDLVHPDALTPEEIALSKYNIKTPPEMKIKNEAWLEEVHKRNYKNQKYLEETRHGETILYGLEAESISAKKLNRVLEELMVPLVGQNEETMKIFQLRKLQDTIQALILHKIK